MLPLCFALAWGEAATASEEQALTYSLLSRNRPEELQIPKHPTESSHWSGHLEHRLVGNGFHRDLGLSISLETEITHCSSDQSSCCEALVVQPLDRALFADLDELQVSLHNWRGTDF
jgi:hypothetical protein